MTDQPTQPEVVDETVDDVPESYMTYRQTALAATGWPTCMVCHVTIHWFPTDRALGTGHVYSDAGRAEFKISKCCEWCFDKMFDFGDDD